MPSLQSFRSIRNFNVNQADRRAFIITINSFGTELTKEDRRELYPTCGRLYPEGLDALARTDEYDQVRSIADYYAEYKALFEDSGNNPGTLLRVSHFKFYHATQ